MDDKSKLVNGILKRKESEPYVGNIGAYVPYLKRKKTTLENLIKSLENLNKSEKLDKKMDRTVK